MNPLKKLWHALPPETQQRIRPVIMQLMERRDRWRFRQVQHLPLGARVGDYWNRHNVTRHKQFSTRQASLDHFVWRCAQYPGYLELMPVAGHDGKRILDYGCGPGHDLVGFLEYSKPARLVGADVSASSLNEARARLALHQGRVDLTKLDPESSKLPFEDGAFDLIHSSGVLHHVPDLAAALQELYRVLAPGGHMQVMVYHYQSLWLHLYVGHFLRHRYHQLPIELPIREAFARSTDGPFCPVANCYTAEEFAAEAASAGFDVRQRGVACAKYELELFSHALQPALEDTRLEAEHRDFLKALTVEHGVPMYEGMPAGVDLVMELTKR